MTEFITVNGQSIDIEDALAWQGIAGNTELRDNIVAMAAVIQHCSNNGITANAAEIQSFLDEFRYADEMENAEEFSAWLKENGFTNEALQARVGREVAELCSTFPIYPARLAAARDALR